MRVTQVTAILLLSCCLLCINAEDQLETCQCPDGFQNCRCVPYYLCNNNNIVSDGGGLLDLRNLPTRPPIDAVTDNGIEEKRGQCGLWKVCCTSPEDEPVIPKEDDYVSSCGTRNEDGLNTRILNSNLREDEAQFGEYPWQAAVLRMEGKVNVFVCGAALIGKRMAVTAAHCVYLAQPQTLKVRLGEYDTQNGEELYPHVDMDVTDIVSHPDFNRNNAHNDLAILFFKEDVKFQPNIDTICLPSANEEFYGSKRCVVTGWGKNAFDVTGEYQRLLKAVSLPMIPFNTCEAQLRKTRLGPYFKLNNGFICAGGELGKDACKGDGGGPFVCDQGGVYKLTGVVAWGIGCGQKDIPGVYMNIGKYVNWIENEANKKGQKI